MYIIPCDEDSPCISWNTLRHREQILGNAFHCASDSKTLTARRTLRAQVRCAKKDSQKHPECKNTHL